MDIENEIAELVRRNLKITACPIQVIREFRGYCNAECGGSYAIGLQQLLKTRYTYENLIPLISTLIQEVEAVKAQPGPEPIKSRRTFADE